jgi:replicative DNA helicase
MFIDSVERQIFSLSQQQTRQNVVPMSEIIKETFRQIEQLHERKDKITGVSSGFIELDEMTAGFQPADLVILAARPSMGKTAFSLNIMAQAALRAETPVAYFSLEMSKEQLAMRLLCSEAQVDASRLRSGFLNDGEWRRLIEAAGKLATAPIYIDDTASLPIMRMQAIARRLKTEKDIGLIMIDYLQLMRADTTNKNASREQIVSEISRNLKGIAKELKVPVIALSQLNRGLESRTDKRPMNSDLRESGSIEQDADVIMFIYRDEVYNKDSEEKGVAEIIISKQRNGPLGTARLKWMSTFTRFENLARDDAPDF